MSIANSPESLSQQIVVGIILVGRLCVEHQAIITGTDVGRYSCGSHIDTAAGAEEAERAGAGEGRLAVRGREGPGAEAPAQLLLLLLLLL